MPAGRYTPHLTAGGSSFEQQFVFVAGDANNDGIVNFADLVTLSQNYGMSESDPDNTLDFYFNSFGVGDFDFADLVILSQNHGLNVN